VFQIQKKSKRCFKLKTNQDGVLKLNLIKAGVPNSKKIETVFKLGKMSRRSSEIKFNQGSRDCSAIMFTTILPRRFAPASSVQSSYLTLSGCQLLSQGGPWVRLARHRRRQQAVRRQRFAAWRIGGCEKIKPLVFFCHFVLFSSFPCPFLVLSW
jgi:hypothetical protein